MSDSFICQYCGKEKSWDDRDYDMGLHLAEVTSLRAFGHAEDITPHLICKQCADETKQHWRDEGW